MEALALIGVAIITVTGSWLTQRQAKKSAAETTRTTMQAQLESSRMATEEGAFARAKSYYEGVIDRQAQEVRELEGDVTRLKARVATLEVELATAQATLRMRYPDE